MESIYCSNTLVRIRFSNLRGSKDGKLLKNVHKRCPFCCACTKHLQYGSYSDQVATVSTNSVAAFSPQNSLENIIYIQTLSIYFSCGKKRKLKNFLSAKMIYLHISYSEGLLSFPKDCCFIKRHRVL